MSADRAIPERRRRLVGSFCAGRRRWSGGSRGATCGAARNPRTASLNTVISTGGVAVGVTALIVVLGVMNGLRDDLRERILVANPHLRVLTYGAGFGWTTGARCSSACASSRAWSPPRRR